MKKASKLKNMKERPAKAYAEAGKTMLNVELDVKLAGDLKEEAHRLGVPYDTLIRSILHRYSSGEMIDKQERARMKYHFQVHNNKDGYWAECLELPGCRSQGDELEELKANLREALNLYLSEESDSQNQFAEPLKSKRGRDIIEIEVDPEVELAMRARQGRLKKPEQKTFAGMPVNWDWKNWHKGMWNPEDDTLFPPKRVGIGWTVNLHAVLKRVGVVK